jgi:hypothetical protein
VKVFVIFLLSALSLALNAVESNHGERKGACVLESVGRIEFACKNGITHRECVDWWGKHATPQFNQIYIFDEYSTCEELVAALKARADKAL